MRVFFLTCLLVGSSYAGLLKLETFDQIAEKVNSLKSTWKAENNFSPDVTPSSFKRVLGVKYSNFKLPAKKSATGLLEFLEIPEEFDSRTKWPNCPTISHIRDQGICGSCWAVAGAGAMTDRVCIASNGTFTEPLSDEELLSCCEDCGNGCQGGYPGKAWEFFMNHGLVTGGGYQSNIGCQPYSIQACEHHSEGPLPQCSSLPMSKTPECKHKCTNPSYTTKSFSNDHHKAKSVYILPDEQAIQMDIMKHGPVEAAFLVYSDFPTYKSGVYQHVTGNIMGGHAVRVIGWGVEDETPYWLVANSWNSNWGDKGTFKILRGSNECGIEEEMIAGLV